MNNRHYHRHHPRRTLDPMLLRRDTLTIPFIIIIIIISIIIIVVIIIGVSQLAQTQRRCQKVELNFLEILWQKKRNTANVFTHRHFGAKRLAILCQKAELKIVRPW